MACSVIHLRGRCDWACMQVFAYPSEGVGEPRPMEPDPEAKEDDDDSGVSKRFPQYDIPLMSLTYRWLLSKVVS